MVKVPASLTSRTCSDLALGLDELPKQAGVLEASDNRPGQDHAPEVGAACGAVPALLTIDIGDFVGCEPPLIDELLPEYFVLVELIGTATRTSHDGLPPWTSPCG